mmetsp:Transcript_30760/g.45561  ORF Transcript_30760/g.45561 Transcript_30760/m.45561 type:complete len:205 (+) Transcript_30760:128-742(+)
MCAQNRPFFFFNCVLFHPASSANDALFISNTVANSESDKCFSRFFGSTPAGTVVSAEVIVVDLRISYGTTTTTSSSSSSVVLLSGPAVMIVEGGTVGVFVEEAAILVADFGLDGRFGLLVVTDDGASIGVFSILLTLLLLLLLLPELEPTLPPPPPETGNCVSSSVSPLRISISPSLPSRMFITPFLCIDALPRCMTGVPSSPA